MKYAAIAFSVAALIAGLVAAANWYRASGTPKWGTMNSAAALSRSAALWTAASVVLSAGASLASALSN